MSAFLPVAGPSRRPSSMRRARAAAAGLCMAAVLCVLPQPGRAAEPAPPENVVNFSSSVEIDVPRDLLGITLQVVRDGSDAATVQQQLKQVLDAALATAKPAAQPGAMEVRTGSFSLQPRYGKEGKINGWQGEAELVLEGKDVPRIAQTAGRIAGMNVTRVGYSISRELAERHRAEVTAQAIAKYRATAEAMARDFGFRGYALREISVQTSEQGAPPRPPMFRAKTMDLASASSEPLPVEPGTGTVGATVSGSVRLLP